jgi:hypothetical protein
LQAHTKLGILTQNQQVSSLSNQIHIQTINKNVQENYLLFQNKQQQQQQQLMNIIEPIPLEATPKTTISGLNQTHNLDYSNNNNNNFLNSKKYNILESESDKISPASIIYPNTVINIKDIQNLDEKIAVSTNLIIDVYLLADCCFKELIQKQQTHHIVDIDNISDTFIDFTGEVSSSSLSSSPFYSSELLERWSINMISYKK